ncbi:hypothetical protein [Oryzobacter telluris]|uniref:hypothetical protein n=1 Tax=Oryzobacter telluris TaxID=3149179 RepID=UPI00370DD328
MDPNLFAGETPGALELERLVQQAQAAFAWRAQVDSYRGRATVEGVEIEVSSTGGVVKLRVTDAACSRGGDALAGFVLDAVHAAQRDLAAQVSRSAADTFGPDSPQARTVEDAVGQRYRRAAVLRPEPEDDDRR